MKVRQRRALYAIAVVLLTLTAGIGFRAIFFHSGGPPSRNRPAAEKTSAANPEQRTAGPASQTTSESVAAQIAASASAAGAIPISSRPRIQLRSGDEAVRLEQRRIAALGSMGLSVPGGAPKPRVPLAKEPLRQPPGREHAMVVKFRDSLVARAEPDGTLLVSAPAPDPALQRVIEEYGLVFSPSQTATEDDLIRLEARALANTQTEPADLGGMLSVRPAKSDADGVWAAAQALQKLDAVEFVTLASLDQPPPPPLPYDITPTTALLSDRQTYRGTNGINIDGAWAARGARGQGVRVTDCEYSFNVAHEDLRNVVAQQPGVSAYYIVAPDFTDDHGTAVLGILGSAENNYGMTGTIPEAVLRFYGEYATVNSATQYRAAAVTAALAASSPGDVVLLEMQTTGAQGGYGPAEYDQAVWTATKTGTDGGIHVVAAAGNGSENLDALEYANYRNRGDSGAIIVGAGNQARAKMDFSTYGTRVNVQGWGDYIVATLGYGDLATYGGDHNQKYSTNFAGTSSASPIVTTAVAAVESITRLALGRPLTPSEMRTLLATTGKPQTGDTNKNIGPLPDVVAALDQKLAGFPLVSSFSPATGSAGTSVAITGSGFTGATNVAFGGTATTNFTVASDTTINATVPATARTGRITVAAPSGTGVSRTNFNIVAAASDAAATAAPTALSGFSARQGSPSVAQMFVVRGDNLDGDLTINAPAGYEVSLDGTNFFAARSATPAAPTDSATNYGTNWITGGNAGLGFGAWAMTAAQGTNYFAGNFLGDPASAGIGGVGANAFGLYANPANSLAEVRADRALARPLKVGDAFTFRWGVNWDANGPGSKGFALYTGGAGMTELLRLDQGGYSENIVFAMPGVTTDTGIAYGTNAMTWTFTRTATNTLQVTATGRGGGTNAVFTTNVAIPGSPDAFRWYAAQLDRSTNSQAETDARQPYFNNLAIAPAFAGGGSLAATTVHVRLATNAPVGPATGNITAVSAGTTLAAIAASGDVAPDYDAWARGYGLDPSGSGARGQDPDSDGLANRAEFFFGSDPTAANASTTRMGRADGGQHVLTFVAFAGGASYEVQTRADLASPPWEPSGLAPTPSADQSGVTAGYRRMECAVPAASKAFYRISATLP